MANAPSVRMSGPPRMALRRWNLHKFAAAVAYAGRGGPERMGAVQRYLQGVSAELPVAQNFQLSVTKWS